MPQDYVKTIEVAGGHGVWGLAGVEQLFAYGYAFCDWVTIYTVPANTVAYLTSLFLNWTTAQTTKWVFCYLDIYDDNDVLQCRWDGYRYGVGQATLALSFSTPLKLAAGWRIDLATAEIPNCAATATITGYTLPA